MMLADEHHYKLISWFMSLLTPAVTPNATCFMPIDSSFDALQLCFWVECHWLNSLTVNWRNASLVVRAISRRCAFSAICGQTLTWIEFVSKDFRKNVKRAIDWYKEHWNSIKPEPSIYGWKECQPSKHLICIFKFHRNLKMQSLGREMVLFYKRWGQLVHSWQRQR